MPFASEVLWVDAFTTVALAGNACAVVMDARGLDESAMLAIARETNLSETAFVFASDVADFGVRYFTPIGEIPLAGHPTIATVHALRESGRIPAGSESVTVHMPAGVIPVSISGTARKRVYGMSQPPPQFGAKLERAMVARALGLATGDLYAKLQPQVVSTGTPQLHVALASRDALDRIAVDRRALFPAERAYFSVHVFARAGDGFALHARHFADFGDVLEDPFTGSATGGMAAYCARYGIVTDTTYTVAQGMHVHRPGSATVTVAGTPPDDIGRITVAGSAIIVMRATLSY